MSYVEWVYANGRNWMTIDDVDRRHIESLWTHNGANWIQKKSFRYPVYVDIDQMVLLCNGVAYTIARYCNDFNSKSHRRSINFKT